MIDIDNLRTASLYINNQLLSRGLLRDGQGIDFADPGDDYEEIAAVMGRIIGVVNDLILRRDRDAEQRESLSATMRALRADNLKHVSDMNRLLEKHAESQRKLNISESSEAALKTQLKSAEAAARGLKEEVARTKALVTQARAACATEVRRRDRQIDTLKKQLGEAGRARGSRGSSAVTTITVSGDVGEDKATPIRSGQASASEEYTLRNETNAFLAELAQNLSQENEALMRVMHGTLKQLRDMSGCNPDNREDDHVLKQATSEDMATELDSVLNHMRTILTNPSFVPIEEVMVREEEISRLKDGWIKMEDRWKEAVHLMDGWRRRMATSGRPVCEEELKMGLRLSPVRVRDVEETRQGIDSRLTAVMEEPEQEMQASPCPAHQTIHQVPAEEQDRYSEHDHDEQSYGDSSMSGDDMVMDDYDAEEPNVEILEQSMVIHYPDFGGSRSSSPPLPEPPHLSPLRTSPSAGNRRHSSNPKIRQKPADVSTIMEENNWEAAAESRPPPPPPHRTKPSQPQSQPQQQPQSQSQQKPQQQPQRQQQTQQQQQQQPHPHRAVRKLAERQRSPSRTSLEDALLGPRRAKDPEPMSIDPTEPQAASRPEPEPMVARDVGGAPQQTPRGVHSRLPLPMNADQPPQQSPLTMANIAAKLAASEREADAARVRAKLKAVRGTTHRGAKRPNLTPSKPTPRKETTKPVLKTSGTGAEDVDPVKQDPVSHQAEGPQKLPSKRKREPRAAKVASRRRSTLSPWELESLMAGKVQRQQQQQHQQQQQQHQHQQQ